MKKVIEYLFFLLLLIMNVSSANAVMFVDYAPECRGRDFNQKIITNGTDMCTTSRLFKACNGSAICMSKKVEGVDFLYVSCWGPYVLIEDSNSAKHCKADDPAPLIDCCSFRPKQPGRVNEVYPGGGGYDFAPHTGTLFDHK